MFAPNAAASDIKVMQFRKRIAIKHSPFIAFTTRLGVGIAAHILWIRSPAKALGGQNIQRKLVYSVLMVTNCGTLIWPWIG